MSQVYVIIIIFEGTLERERVVGATALTFHRVLVVANVFASTVPADTAWFTCILHRVKERLLPLIVRAVRLNQIDYVEFVADVFAYVAHFEVKPLCIGCRSMVILQNQIVCVLANA